jgi:hypothetical protein
MPVQIICPALPPDVVTVKRAFHAGGHVSTPDRNVTAILVKGATTIPVAAVQRQQNMWSASFTGVPEGTGYQLIAVGDHGGMAGGIPITVNDTTGTDPCPA